MNRSLSWIDGVLTDNPVVETDNRGLLVGYGVFETIKVDQGKPHFLGRHLRRLERACERVGLEGTDFAAISQATVEVIESNPSIKNLSRLRVTITQRGSGSSTLITLNPMQEWPETTSCIVVPWVRNERSPIAGIKSTSYLDNVIALNWAQEQGFSEGILLNSIGQLCEGTTSNVFIVKHEQVLTPSIESGPLPGVVREVLIDHGLAEQVVVTLDELLHADEIFITSSTRGIHPVLKLGERSFAEVGAVTRATQRAFQEIDLDDI